MNAIQRDEANYNFKRFARTSSWPTPGERSSATASGPAPPDFELPLASGEFLRLSQLRGRPVLLHFASYT